MDSGRWILRGLRAQAHKEDGRSQEQAGCEVVTAGERVKCGRWSGGVQVDGGLRVREKGLHNSDVMTTHRTEAGARGKDAVKVLRWYVPLRVGG